MKNQTKRQQLDYIQKQLELDRTSFLSHWLELADYVAPRRERINITDTNRGDKRNQNIIDSTATIAMRTLRSGMMSGVTSPARPWFRVSMADPEVSELGNVKRWLDTVGNRMSTYFLRSNLDNVLPIIYGDMGLFGTGCMYIEEDFEGGAFKFQPYQIGSYSVAQNSDLKVDTFFRTFKMTSRQMIQKFGLKNPNKPKDIDWSVFSAQIKDDYDNNKLETQYDICHMIRPNPDYKPGSVNPKFKKYSSDYYEQGTGQWTSQQVDRFLRESGYDYFPILTPRWEINGEDVYGTSCPGMEALGDVKQLQVGEKRSLQAVDKMVNPPLIAPTSMRNAKVSLTPGDITYNDSRDGDRGFKTVYDIQFRIMELEQKQAQVRSRIQRTFFEDLFLMLASSDRRQITAREIDERHEEKLLALGPVLEQLNQDLLDPLIDICFEIMNKQGLFPPPPQEIAGSEMKIEYISIMAQAQKMIGLSSIDRFSGFVSQAAQFDPTVLDKVNSDELIDSYADLTSVPSKIVRTDDEVAGIRSNRQQQQQQMQQAELGKTQAETAAKLSQAKTSDDSILSQLIGG